MSNIVSRLLRTDARNWSTLPIRIAVGSVMLSHGAQKLFGWWGGNGFERTAASFSNNLGFEPGVLWAALAGGSEFFGGLALLLGLGTRFGALAVAITMAVATKVHWGAFFLSNNGIEFTLTLMLGAVALLLTGGGALSADARLGGNKRS